MVSVWIQEDQLTPASAALEGRDPKQTAALFIESRDWATRLPHHKQKLVLVWAAMQGFARELEDRGFTIDYRSLGDERSCLQAHLADRKPAKIVLLDTAEYGVAQRRAKLVEELGGEAEIVPNNLFLSDADEFAAWAGKRKTLVMETFYRGMRRRTGLLMDGDEPEGGQWNYDRDNRETPDQGHDFPPIPRYPPGDDVAELIELVEKEFPDHFGALEEFAWPVIRADAEDFARDFLDRRLDRFGPYQDAIVTGEPVLYHSLLSPLINLGLLDPLWLCREAEKRYRDGKARLNSVEGFIRQIIGWREFVYQVYRLRMPGYIDGNHFGAKLDLPQFYWDGDTDLFCVSDAVKSLIRNGINHHIQRLMITGNFALIAGIDPQQVNDWYWLAYADAWEWVVTPNVIGMALYADGGVLGTKPYAASANYIHKMSDCCARCAYDHKKTTGDDACPFNSLYWDFIDRNYDELDGNRRMALILKNWAKRDADKKDAIRRQAKKIRKRLADGERV